MTLLQERFVAEYLKGKSGQDAYIAAGGAPNNARKSAWILLNKNEEVMAAVAQAKKDIREKAKYDAEAAMNEADRLMKVAEEKGQMQAVASLFQTKTKIAGLIDKHVTPLGMGFQILINGIDNSRVAMPAIEIKELNPSRNEDSKDE